MKTLRSKYRKIKKPRRCFACLQEFLPGTVMKYDTATGVDGIYETYICEKCSGFLGGENDEKYGLRDLDENYYEEGCIAWFLEGEGYKPNELQKFLRRKHEISKIKAKNVRSIPKR